MFVVGNLIWSLAILIKAVLDIYWWIIIARAVISWVNADPYNPIVRGIYTVTEPVLYWVRRSLPVFAGGIDFSPIVVLLAIGFLESFLVRTLLQTAALWQQ